MTPGLKNLGGALLAVLALLAGGWASGWQGVVLVLSGVVLVLLLQFTRVLRALRASARAPVGVLPSCLGLHARLEVGWPLLKVLEAAGSLGESVPPSPGATALLALPVLPAGHARYRWRDAGGDQLLLDFDAGQRLRAWQLLRAEATTAPAPAPAAAPAPSGPTAP